MCAAHRCCTGGHVELGEDSFGVRAQRVERDVELARDLRPGEVITQPWMVSDIDLPRVLARNSFPDANAAASDARVRLVVKCIADVKGSPFDPSAEVVVDLVPA